MMKVSKVSLSILGGLFLLLASLQSLSVGSAPVGNAMSPTPELSSPVRPVIFEPTVDIDNLPLRDNTELYEYDLPGSVITLFVTVRKGNPADRTDHTWAEVNQSTKWSRGAPLYGATAAKAEAIVQFGDENGPRPGEYGYGVRVANATIEIRGASASAADQKSYKIELHKSSERWRGQQTIVLNKHIYDYTRARNKLNFDLMKQIPDLVSLRTQFVHLYVKDETTDSPQSTFADYGLFTQIEQPNRDFLENHRLDPDGQLYKATLFEFHRYPDAIRLVNDPLYSEEAFSKVLEIKGSHDHSKLIQMLEDVNNYSIPIQMTFEKYFDADNYFTWMAYNILVGNVDTQSQNFFLYSPKNSRTWYFLPWDYDGAMSPRNRYPYAAWEVGVSNYWGTRLANRLLRMPSYREMLDAKVDQLRGLLTPERIKSLLDEYRPVAEMFLFRLPDVQHLPAARQEIEQDFEEIPGAVQRNYELYLESLETPMPFFLGTPAPEDDGMSFIWDESYDFAGEDITYHFVLARDPELSDVVSEQTLPGITNARTDVPEPGEYYWRVIATNEAGNTQLPFDSLFDANGIPRSGLKRFYIGPDGEVIE